MSPKAYAIMHRMHHAYTDTEMDPHSPSYSKNVFDMMWRTRNFYRDIMNGTMVVEDRFTKNLPGWDAFDKWGDSSFSRIMWAGIYIAIFVVFATSPWQYLLLLPILAMGAVHGAIINWYAHKYGYTNYKLKNTSHNLISVDVLMLGESYHNNHHKFPSSINFGRKWHEIDPIYPVIRLLGWMKIIKLPNLSTTPAQGENEF
jgi:stearoyl-CoA desaturase (delta-9 desaturase)